MMEDPMALLPEDDEMSDDLIEQGTEAVFQLGLRLNREEARAVFVAALAAIDTSGTHRVVGVKATAEVLNYMDVKFDMRPSVCVEIYDAMLSAAPKLG